MGAQPVVKGAVRHLAQRRADVIRLKGADIAVQRLLDRFRVPGAQMIVQFFPYLRHRPEIQGDAVGNFVVQGGEYALAGCHGHNSLAPFFFGR